MFFVEHIRLLHLLILIIPVQISVGIILVLLILLVVDILDLTILSFEEAAKEHCVYVCLKLKSFADFALSFTDSC